MSSQPAAGAADRHDDARFIPRALLDGLDAIVWQRDPATWRFTFVSAGAERLLGYPAAQWLDDPEFWRTHVHAEDRQRVVAYSAECVSRGSDHELEYRMIAADGRVVWLRDIVHVAGAPAPRELHGVTIDVSRQRELVSELRATQERFARFAEASLDAVVVHERGRIVDVNDACSAMLGWPREELLGREVTAFTEASLRELLQAHIAAGSEAPLQGFALRRSGERFPVELRGRNVMGARGPARLVVVRDLTESRRAEQELRDSEAGLRLMLQQLPAFLWATDRELRVTSAMGREMEAFGEAPDEWVGRPIAEALAYSAHADAALEAHQGALDGRHGFYLIEWRGRTFEVHVEPLRDAAGQVSGVLALATDLTDAQRVASALAETEERYRRLVEAMVDAVVVHVHGRVVFGNGAAARMIGAPDPQGLVGRSAVELVAPEERERAGANIERLLAEGEPVPLAPYRLQRDDGRVIDVELSASVVDYAGERAVQIVCRDVSQRLHTEAALRDTTRQLLEAQKLEAVGRLAGGIAHDFNNIVTVITTYTQLIASRLAATDPRQGDLREVQQAARRAADLTRQLLAFSRRQAMQPVPVDLNGVVRGMEQMLQRLIGEDVRIEARLAPGEARIRADRAQLEQVLMNLLVNARDAMPGGGTVTVATARQPLDADAARRVDPAMEAGDWVRLSVRDTGTGMPPGVRDHAFEPFFTTKPVGQGTGLGLATVHGIVTQSGGFITLDSEPERGTRVEIWFPEEPGAAPPPTPPEGTEAVPADTGARATILLVEDEGAVREVTRRILEHHGYRVLAARHADEALTVARYAGHIDLLLTDVVMPGMGGRELAERLLAIRPELPVLFMSGYTDDEVLRRGHGVPGPGLLAKPFTVDTLVARVREALGDRTTTRSTS
jgi:PAS domain S-box-containing protein